MGRLRALTLNLLPVQVDPDAINDPTSRVITPQVISSYIAAAGDLTDAVRTRCNILLIQPVDVMTLAPVCIATRSRRLYEDGQL